MKSTPAGRSGCVGHLAPQLAKAVDPAVSLTRFNERRASNPSLIASPECIIPVEWVRATGLSYDRGGFPRSPGNGSMTGAAAAGARSRPRERHAVGLPFTAPRRPPLGVSAHADACA